MSLVRAKGSGDLAAAVEQWHTRPASRISHHGGACCEQARAWLLTLDRSRRAAEPQLSGPKWIVQQYPWGPSDWPIYWCELVQAENLDCGALADLTRTVFTARGVVCLSVQLVQQYSTDDAKHWISTWREASRHVDWIVGPFSYHEACAVLGDEGNIRIWDSTDNVWISRRATDGYGAVVAIRIPALEHDFSSLSWEGQRIEPNVWQEL